MKKINAKEFDQIKKTERGLFILKFGSKTCGPCNMMKPVLERLDEQNPDVNLYEIDTDESPELAQQFGIRSIPTIHLCENREVIYSFYGTTALGALQYAIDNIDDPYFREHGEFKKPEEKKSLVYPAVILAVIAFLGIMLYFAR